MFRVTSAIFAICLTLGSCKKQEAINPSSDNFVETIPQSIVPIVRTINTNVKGYYESLPSHYNQSRRSYPLLICIHGSGQFGNGSSDLNIILNEGLPELIKDTLFPANFKVEDRNYSFIVLAPQFVRNPSVDDVMSFVNDARRTYRVDVSRIYISGFSNGGVIVGKVIGVHPDVFAATVDFAGIWGGKAECKRIAEAALPVWLFHNVGDERINISVSKNFVLYLNSYHTSIAPKLTIFPTFGLYGHDAWTKATDPNYRENNLNIYEWMLQYSR